MRSKSKRRERSTIEKAKVLFNNMEMGLTKCYILSVLLYGAEVWTFTETVMKRLEAFGMWVHRRIFINSIQYQKEEV